MGVEGSFADLLRKCAWNGVGGVSASGVSALLSSASCVGLKIWQSRPRTRLGKVEASFTLLSLLHRLQREVGELRNEVAALRNAIQKINFVFLCHDSG